MPRRPDGPPVSRQAHLAARQRALLARSAELRGAFATELAEGWHQLETPLGWWLKLQASVAAVTQSVRDQARQRPWLAVVLPGVALSIWRWVRRPRRAARAPERRSDLAWRGARRLLALYGTWRSVRPWLAPIMGPVLGPVLMPLMTAALRRWRRR